MKVKRTDRLNSLLKRVISEVIFRDYFNPDVSEFITVTKVDITKDLHHAKVYVSIMDSPEKKEKTLQILQKSAGFIGSHASKKVVMRYFPVLTFKLDDSADAHAYMGKLMADIQSEREQRQPDE